MAVDIAYDAVVVGAGHNGLVAAAYLARAGVRVLVVERRDRVGGIADTIELAPGVRAPAVAQTVGRLRPSVVRELGLRTHGLSLVAPDVRSFAPQPDGRAITLWADPGATADGLKAWSTHDAERYVGFDRLTRSISLDLTKRSTRKSRIHLPEFMREVRAISRVNYRLLDSGKQAAVHRNI